MDFYVRFRSQKRRLACCDRQALRGAAGNGVSQPLEGRCHGDDDQLTRTRWRRAHSRSRRPTSGPNNPVEAARLGRRCRPRSRVGALRAVRRRRLGGGLAQPGPASAGPPPCHGDQSLDQQGHHPLRIAAIKGRDVFRHGLHAGLLEHGQVRQHRLHRPLIRLPVAQVNGGDLETFDQHELDRRDVCTVNSVSLSSVTKLPTPWISRAGTLVSAGIVRLSLAAMRRSPKRPPDRRLRGPSRDVPFRLTTS